jgi:nitronate monooxygenase
VTIVGYECGGGAPLEEITTLIQVPQVVDAVKIPVLAGGGIGDARGFVTALALGAVGVVIGTRFMLTQESMVHQSIKETLVKAQASDTMVVQRSIRIGERVIRNERAQKVLAMEEKGATLEELLPFIAGGEDTRRAWAEGDFDTLLPCGQVIGLIHGIPTVKEVVDNIMKGAREIIGRLSSLAASTP